MTRLILFMQIILKLRTVKSVFFLNLMKMQNFCKDPEATN